VSDIHTLQDDLALLESSVAEAAELVMGFFKHDPKSWKKNDVSPVSEADLASDALLQKRLLGARPDYGWLSEETEDSDERLSRDRVWVVDPIDGTNSFLQGNGDFTVCAGLVRGGQAVAGAVINPVHLSRKNVMRPERWRGDVPQPKPGYIGSLAYQLCLIAMGERDAAISVSKLHEWDIAAAGLILSEAGGVVTDQHARPLRYNQAVPQMDGMICAAPGLHAAICENLIPKEPG